MPSKSNLNDIDLVSFFQDLITTNKEGTLIISEGKDREIFYIRQGKINLLASNNYSELTLENLLVASGLLTEEQLKKALQRQQELAVLKKQQPAEQKLEAVLAELGYIKKSDLEQQIGSIISEEIYGLFASGVLEPPESKRQIEFEFSEGPISPEIKYPVNFITTFVLDINPILNKAKSRQEECTTIKQSIAHHGIIFTLTVQGEKSASRTGQDPTVSEVLPLINGIRTVEDIVNESSLSEFQAYQVLYNLLDQETIREVTLQELKTNGHRLVKEGKHELALALYQQAHRTSPLDIPILENLAEVLALVKKTQAASQIYEKLARLLLEKDRGPLAVIAYQKALDLQPEDIKLHQAVFDLLKAQQSKPEAIKHGQELLKLYAVNQKLEEASGLAEELMDLSSPDKVLALMDKIPETHSTYEQLAQRLLAKDQGDLAIAVYQKAIQYQAQDINLYQTFFKLLKIRQATAEALKYGKELLKLHAAKKDIDAAVSLAQELMSLGPPEETLDIIGQLDQTGQVYEQLGQRLSTKDQDDLAVIAYQKALQAQPQNIKLHQTLLTLLKSRQATAEAFKYGRDLLKLYLAGQKNNETINLSAELMEWGPPDEILEQIAGVEKADQLYEQLGQLLTEKDKPDLAILAYQKAIQCQPSLEELTKPPEKAEATEEKKETATTEEGEKVEVKDSPPPRNEPLEKSIQLHLAVFHLLKNQILKDKKNTPETINYGKQLLKLYAAGKKLTEASALAEELKILGPIDFEVRAYISKIYFELGEFKKSRQEIDKAIAEMSSQKVNNLIKAYQEILKIEPKHSDARYQLDMLLKAQARKKRRRIVFASVLAAAFILAGLITLAVQTELVDYARLEELKKQITAPETEEQFLAAIEQYKSFKTKLPLYTLVARKKEIDRLQTELKALKYEKRLANIETLKQMQDLFQTARDMEDKSDSLQKPLEFYQKILNECQAKQFDELAKQTQKRIGVITQYLNAAQDLYQKATHLDKQNSIEEAREMLIKMANDYPKSELALSIKLPVKIESKPPGAKIYLNEGFEGETPLKVYLPLQGGTQLVVKYPKFQTVKKPINGYEQTLLKIVLEKTLAWTYTTKGIIEALPIIYRDICYVGSRDGNLYALGIKSGEPRWQFTTDAGSDIKVTPVLDPVHGRIFILSGDNDLYVVSLTTGSMARKIPLDMPVKVAPTISNDGKKIFLSSPNGSIYGLDADSGASIWKFTTGGKIQAASTLLRQALYTPSSDSNLYVVNSQTGDFIWKLKLGGELVTQPLIQKNICYVGSSNKILYAVDLSNRSIKWRYKAQGSITGITLFGKDTILATSRDGACHSLNNQSGKPRWQFKTKNSINGPAATYAQDIYLADDDGTIYAIDSAGKEIWRYKTGGKILASPVVTKEFIFVGSSDRKVYTLER
ncbi:PQQ-binding-like beta-propeller repeat protein [Planctomycetota bacterium]